MTFKDARGIAHRVDVEAESLFEAAVLAVKRFRNDPWVESVGPSTLLDVDVREPATTHTITLQQVERWIGGSSTNPHESLKKAKLKTLLVQR